MSLNLLNPKYIGYTIYIVSSPNTVIYWLIMLILTIKNQHYVHVIRLLKTIGKMPCHKIYDFHNILEIIFY